MADRGRLQGKVALVTGAASGIGEATAALFAREGAITYGADVRELTGALEDGVVPLVLDVSDENQWIAAVGRIVGEQGRLDVLVNNAGISGGQDNVVQLSVEEWNRVISVNQTGVMLGMRTAVPAMRDIGGGAIVNISSVWGTKAVAGGASYQAAKAAVRHLSKHAALAFAPDKIRVNSVHPGVIETPLVTDGRIKDGGAGMVALTPLKRMGRPVEIGYACLYLASDEAAFVTGIELNVDGGYLAT